MAGVPVTLTDDAGRVRFEGRQVGGGGSLPVYEAINGLVKDYDPIGGIDACSALLLDPTAQPWQAAHEYSNEGEGAGNPFVGAQVTPTTNPNGVKFKAAENGAAVSGTVEPTWSEDGTTPVDDGTVARPLVWNPSNVYAGAWQATHAFASGHAIIANGYAWFSDGGGNTGGSEPDWPDAPDLNQTVSDGAITWTSAGPATVWAAATRYGFVVNADPTTGYSQANVIPTDAVAGTSYVFNGQPLAFFGTTGLTEPAGWEASTPGDGSAWMDGGDILWLETTAAEKLVLTGIVAPADAKVISLLNAAPVGPNTTVTVEDQVEAENDYGPDAPSDAGNRFDNDDSNLDIATQGFTLLVYLNGAWTPIRAAA